MALKKIVVTGSLGYLGSVLTKYLIEKGYNVLGYDTGFFKDSTVFSYKDTPTVFSDARDFNEKYLKGVDVLIHLAGISNDPMSNLEPSRVYDPTRQYALKIARLCKKNGTRFIFASSCSVYGKGGVALLQEDSETAPQTPYSLNKLQIEQDLANVSDNSFSPIAFRFATVFGFSPRIRFDLVVNMFAGMALTSKKIILNSDGQAWRPNIHILDVANAFRAAVESDYRGGKLLTLNVGDEKNNFKILDIAKAVQEEVPGCDLSFLTENTVLDGSDLVRDRKIQSGTDTRTYRVSFEKIKKTLPTFNCDWSLKAGIKDLLAKLKEVGLTEEKFKDLNFYRLQKMEYLLKNGFISDDLRWIK